MQVGLIFCNPFADFFCLQMDYVSGVSTDLDLDPMRNLIYAGDKHELKICFSISPGTDQTLSRLE